MNEKKQDPPEFPKVRYAGTGKRTIDGDDLLRSKAGRRLLDQALKVKINPKESSKSSD